MPRTNQLTDVFRYINTHDNDPSVCWEWTGSRGGRDGRGYITVDKRKMLSYRVVYELVHGEIPEGMVVRHKCDNPLCCNPVHLELGTHVDNEADKYERDRWGFTHQMLHDIRRYAALGMTYQKIADQLNTDHGTNVSASGVGKVVRGDRRKNK